MSNENLGIKKIPDFGKFSEFWSNKQKKKSPTDYTDPTDAILFCLFSLWELSSGDSHFQIFKLSHFQT